MCSAGWRPLALRGFTRISIPVTLRLWEGAIGLCSAGWRSLALRGLARIGIPLTLRLWERDIGLHSAGWRPLALRAFARISIPAKLRLWDRAIGPGRFLGFIHLSSASTRENSKGFLDPSKCRAQLPVHYAIRFADLAALERMKIFDGKTVGGLYLLGRCVTVNTEHGVVIRLVGNQTGQ